MTTKTTKTTKKGAKTQSDEERVAAGLAFKDREGTYSEFLLLYEEPGATGVKPCGHSLATTMVMATTAIATTAAVGADSSDAQIAIATATADQQGQQTASRQRGRGCSPGRVCCATIGMLFLLHTLCSHRHPYQ